MTLQTRGFTDDEARTILAATLVPPAPGTGAEAAAAWRWVPWLCAYTGARVGEIVGLLREEVLEIEGEWAILFKGKADTVKKAGARTIPLHPHLVEQGFVEFVLARSKGPLFVEAGKNPDRVANVIGERVRKLGIVDGNLAPNDAWRHCFVNELRTAGVGREVMDTILGRAPKPSKFGFETPFCSMSDAISKLPRIIVEAAASD